MGGAGSGKPAGYGKAKSKSNESSWEEARKKLLEKSKAMSEKPASLSKKLREDNFRFDKNGKKSTRGKR